jgi:hypothetical protein
MKPPPIVPSQEWEPARHAWWNWHDEYGDATVQG